MRSANTGTQQPVVTPKLATPEAVAKAPELEVNVGEAAPSNISFDAAKMEQLIKERVEAEVSQRIKAIEADDPTRSEMRPDEDQQFANFDKKLDVFGVNFEKALPGFHLHWFNDDGDRIMRMLVMGFTMVKRTDVAINEKVAPLNQDLGENIAVYVGKKTDGTPMRAFLMKIPEEMYAKRYARAQEHNDKIEEAIRFGSIGPALSQGGYAGTDQGQVKIKYEPRSLGGMARAPR